MQLPVYVCVKRILLIMQYVSVSSKEVVGAIPGMGQLFKCSDSKHGRVVIPESMVVSEAAIAQMTTKQKVQQITGTSVDMPWPASKEEEFAKQFDGTSLAEQQEALKKAKEKKKLADLNRAMTTQIDRDEQIRQMRNFESMKGNSFDNRPPAGTGDPGHYPLAGGARGPGQYPLQGGTRGVAFRHYPDAGQLSGGGAVNKCTALSALSLDENTDQYIIPGQLQKYIGNERGIQGHQNSCYLDSTVFGLFAASDAFDNMFLEQQGTWDSLPQRPVSSHPKKYVEIKFEPI